MGALQEVAAGWKELRKRSMIGSQQERMVSNKKERKRERKKERGDKNERKRQREVRKKRKKWPTDPTNQPTNTESQQ